MKDTDEPGLQAAATSHLDLTLLERWWLDGSWTFLVEADSQRREHHVDQPTALLFFAIAHLQTGDLNRAKLLVQKALNLGCDHNTAKQALLAASVEKLADATRIQQGAQGMASNLPGLGSNERAKQLRAAALRSVGSVTRVMASTAKTTGNKVPAVDRPAFEIARTVGQYGRIGILSGYYPGTRFNSQVNHRLYASRYGYRYIFDSTPRFDKRTYMRKLEAILEYLDLFDWLFWIDDDAYFTDFSVPLERFIGLAPDASFIVCKSPSTKSLFTRISSGQFLLRNTALSKKFIEAALSTDLREVQKWWKSDLGMFTKGDQDAMVYLLESNPQYAAPFFSILDHHNFNNREFEFKQCLDEHFLVHFTGTQKHRDKALFCQRMHCNEFLSPAELVRELVLR